MVDLGVAKNFTVQRGFDGIPFHGLTFTAHGSGRVAEGLAAFTALYQYFAVVTGFPPPLVVVAARGGDPGWNVEFVLSGNSGRLFLWNEFQYLEALCANLFTALVSKRRQRFEKISGAAPGRFTLRDIVDNHLNGDIVAGVDLLEILLLYIRAQHTGVTVLVEDANEIRHCIKCTTFGDLKALLAPDIHHSGR